MMKAEDTSRIGFATPTIIVASVVVYYISVWFYFSKNRGLSLPPGPKRHRITGNLDHLPKEKLWMQAAEWGKIYGEPSQLKSARRSFT